jgi:hypothetical protein
VLATDSTGGARHGQRKLLMLRLHVSKRRHVHMLRLPQPGRLSSC